ncbi:BAX protein [hydrothermal vent metagenome]|uniref:BAX protein n=1 Tax=hydrothermal vent metagenome TaxID=652676 RepID=A0A1W1E5L3_9ZZZZ
MKRIIFTFIIISITPIVWSGILNLNPTSSPSIEPLKTPNFEKMKDIKQMKIAFFNYLSPLVEAENNKIRATRLLIENDQLSQSQMKKLAKKYRLKKADKATLLTLVDIIPTSLVLAQAAIESNWGRSRFAKHWHNYFGIWCFSKGCGVVPKRRDKGAEHEIMNFSSTHQSIRYYLLNLNRNHHYQLLRKIRTHKRKRNLKLTGKSLSEGLDKYSAIGHEYIELVQSIIRQNQLSRFD